jgi:hypothetical protein
MCCSAERTEEFLPVFFFLGKFQEMIIRLDQSDFLQSAILVPLLFPPRVRGMHSVTLYVTSRLTPSHAESGSFSFRALAAEALSDERVRCKSRRAGRGVIKSGRQCRPSQSGESAIRRQSLRLERALLGFPETKTLARVIASATCVICDLRSLDSTEAKCVTRVVNSSARLSPRDARRNTTGVLKICI